MLFLLTDNIIFMLTHTHIRKTKGFDTMSKKTRGNLLLLFTSFIWGTAFVAQRVSMDYIGPFTFNAVRMLLAGMALLIVVALMDAIRRRRPELEAPSPADPKANKLLLIGGIATGGMLFIASSFQQFGVKYTTAGKAGFITALYIVLVPVLGLFLRKRVGRLVWVGVGVAVAGLYLLCISGSFSVGLGDALMVLCALFFAMHILIIDYFSPKVDGVKMSCIQFFVCSALGFAAMLIFETPVFSEILAAWQSIIYAGVISGGMGYTLQIIAQRDTEPTVASLLMSLESVFAVLAGVVLLHESMSWREGIGCLLMFTAIVLAQIPEKRGKPTN